MARGHKIRRRGLLTAAALLGASAATVSFAGPAGAATVPLQNHIIYGAGSNTTFIMMTQLSVLFNESPGCDLAAPSGGTQNLDYRCPNPPNNTGGENGLGDGLGWTPPGAASPQGDPENPYNDVVVELPALGSSNGIKEFDQRGTNNAFADFARSSRGPNNGLNTPTGISVPTPNTDPQGLNFVAYAQDAVPWLHWTKVSAVSTPSAKIKNLSIPQLAAIYNGTITDWSQIPKGTAGPIKVYMAQAGSGTEGTWKQALQLTSDVPAGVTAPSTHVIFENEIHGILANSDEGNAIFYFSFGKFTVDCKGTTGTCGNDKSPAGSVMALGSESNTTGGTAIVPSSATIQNGTFPTDRYLYNVYANSSAPSETPSIPATSQAALNFMSEWGMICKQDSAVDSNSVTNATYGTEIKNIITANGFFPLTSGVMDASNVTHNAVITDPAYKFVDPLSQTATPSTATGACRVFTTDGDGTA